jgi:mRNA-degrading endonuclease RelE of RelBE toxin-antitoxin system
MRLIVSGVAARELAGLPSRDRTALLQKLLDFAAEPFENHRWALPMRGRRDAVRIRQGDWRAVCRVDRNGDVVTVEFIANRREVYR